MFSGEFNQNTGGQQPEFAQPVRQFQEITREAPDHIVAQLVGHDLVHQFGTTSIEDLRLYRLGGDRYDRTCFAIMEGDLVHSAIYVSKSYGALRSDRDFSGNVAYILEQPAKANSRSPESLILYSISNITNVAGVGQELVTALYTHIANVFYKARASTLSPLRSFDQDFSEKDRIRFIALPVPEQKRIVLDYLLTGDNLVQKFHMGNGARIADIKLQSGDKSLHPKTGEVINHLAMVNYAYDVSPAVLMANADAFKAVKKALRVKDTDPVQSRQTIAHGIFARVSSMLLEETGWTDSDFTRAPSAPVFRF